MARQLAGELEALGAADVRVSETCTVYARLPGNVGHEVACMGLLAHMDTSPAVSGKGVRPIVHANYQGGPIVLPADPTQVLSPADHPVLETMIGDDVITTDGTTLLGSDDKSGVAAIMTLVDILARNPEIAHGPIAVAFSADEEVGRGVDAFDVEGFGAAFAYTVDGDALGEINHETWSARLATVVVGGVSAHPGTAKGTMVNAAYTAAAVAAAIPPDMRPESTEGREGFTHLHAGELDVERSVLRIILRDFETADLDAREAMLERLVHEVADRHPGVEVHVSVEEQYRNMNEVLTNRPELVEYAKEATARAGLHPVTRPIRGGTDGSKLTFRGLPCPNLFTGGFNFHSRLEFNSRRGLEKTTETLVHLATVVAERAVLG